MIEIMIGIILAPLALLAGIFTLAIIAGGCKATADAIRKPKKK